ncbi:MAG TPA: TolC family protein [Chthoniobacteraceae bacterium]|jgi:outer membrane protein TolC
MFRPVSLLLVLLLPIAAFSGESPEKTRILSLTLETALQMALAKNFSIEVERFQPKIAAQQVRRELGRFDPNFDIRLDRSENTERDRFDNGLHLESSRVNRRDNLSSGLTGVTAWGTEYDLGLGTTGSTGTDNAFGENFESTGSLSVRQPLLRDAGPAVNLAQVRIARNNVAVSEWQLRRRVIDVMTTTTFVYNELQLAIESREVAERSRGLALQLLRDDQARVDIGVKIPLDVMTARAEAAAREEGVILAERTVLDNENLLKQLTTSDILQMLGVRVKIKPPVMPRFHPEVMDGIRDALALRPEYRQAILDIEQRKIRVAFQKNQALPRIDLTGSLALLGLDNDFGTSVSRIGRRDESVWTAGVIFSIPLGNRAAKASLSTAQLEVAKALVQLQQLEQQIVVDVDNAAGQITTGRQRIASTAEAKRLAAESLQAGGERLRAGAGTTFEVLDLQENLASAEFAELRARSDFNKAVSEYHRQTGTTLREHNVVLQ